MFYCESVPWSSLHWPGLNILPTENHGRHGNAIRLLLFIERVLCVGSDLAHNLFSTKLLKPLTLVAYEPGNLLLSNSFLLSLGEKPQTPQNAAAKTPIIPTTNITSKHVKLMFENQLHHVGMLQSKSTPLHLEKVPRQTGNNN